MFKRLNKNENYFEGIRRLNKENAEKGIHWRYQLINCRHCFACSLNYSAEWATRIMFEAKYHEHNYFITLTYDEEHLPIKEKMQMGEWEFENDGTWTGTLEPDHMDKFKKSLRRYLEYHKKHQGVKIFYCGEYGETTGRPHYHAILMNCPLDITQFYDTHIDKNYKAHWKSKEIDKLWKHGIHDIAECEWSCAAYVARYCAKKWNKQADPLEYYSMGKIPEFVRMSDNIGIQYFQEHKDEIYKTDSVIIKSIKGRTGTFKPPKAYDKLLEKENPELYDKIKESRKHCMERSQELSKKVSDMTDMQKLRMSAEKTITKNNLLPRQGEF